MRTSIATVSLSGELPDKLAAIAGAGFDGVEIFETDFLAYNGSPRDVGRMARDLGLEITLFQPFRDFEGMPDPLRSRAFDRAERKFDVMQELGTDLILVCSNTSASALGGIDRAAADFQELGQRAAKRNLRVGYEALAWGKHISDHRDAWEIVRRADHSNIGLILDSFHSLSRKIDVGSLLSIPKEKIFIVQLADAPMIEMDLLYLSRHFRCMPGEGELPVTDFVAAIAQTGYDGYFSLEIFNDQFRGGATRSIAADGHRSLFFLGDQIARTGPSASLTVPEMPPQAKVHGISFIEFSVNETDARGLRLLLSSMGFDRTAVHRTKKVEVFQQGRIRILVNTDDEGFANAAYAVHGASAYAIALEVEDAGEALARAVTLGADSFEQDVVSGQLRIPAIRGVGGGLVYLLDQKTYLRDIWSVDFEPVHDDALAAYPLLEDFDHVGQTVAYDEMLTWILFYTSIFQAGKSPVVDVIDPGGVVRSQVIRNDSGSLRLTINGADNRRTLAGHFIAEKFGSGIQHLAFRTSDIFATAASLRRFGFQPLHISANYYGDVEARFGLDPSLTDRLKAENILYDRDEQGEFFQLYSGSFAEGFFFEIVERRAYEGYGAPNAPFRIAALKRQVRPDGLPRA